ncbi:protein of unknown function [Candidatus Nitrotoga arctica]|uniref:Uncharacterized protein n=1 Tax=Candidatus Nitrotoga arctica TaxID=453162 RepID=A0ABM8YWP0_9PROT|nr:protein of unknown function [Candidatus Nitrotoga arctica]
MINDWVARMKHERYLSLNLITDSTPISNLVTLTFTGALSDQIFDYNLMYRSKQESPRNWGVGVRWGRDIVESCIA